MRKKWLVSLLVLALLCAGCVPGASKDGPGEGEVELWFLVGDNEEEGAALACEYRTLPQEGESGEELLALLLAGPESGELRNPFPRGTTVKSLRVEGDLALVDLSEAYESLSGVDLSLADGCVVLTLCQLPQVERVYLTVEGRRRPFRDQVLGSGDFLLQNGAGTAGEMTVRLWFPGEGGIVPEERTLSLRMGDRPEIAVVQALLAGPESGGLERVCPEGTVLLSLTERGERWIVDVSGDWLEGESDPRRFQAVVATLREWEPDMQVEVFVEGQGVEG